MKRLVSPVTRAICPKRSGATIVSTPKILIIWARCLILLNAVFKPMPMRALELFDRAYYVDPSRARDGLLRSGIGHAITLRDRGQIEDAQNVLHHLRDIDPQNSTVNTMLEAVKIQKNQPPELTSSWGKFMPEWKWNLSKRNQILD